jgi:hypothetical protein
MENAPLNQDKFIENAADSNEIVVEELDVLYRFLIRSNSDSLKRSPKNLREIVLL